MDGSNISFLLGWPIFRCHVSFRVICAGSRRKLCWVVKSLVILRWICVFFSKRVVLNSNPLLVGNKRFISKKIPTNIIISISYIYPGLWFIDFTPQKKSIVINRGLDVEALRRGELWQFGCPKSGGVQKFSPWGTSQLRCSEVQPTLKPLEITYTPWKTNMSPKKGLFQ